MTEKNLNKNIHNPGNRKVRILLVEDNLINQEVAVSILSGRGHVVRIANNGAEAIRYISEETFDIILMDVEMPVMNGCEATVRIREIEKETKTHIHIIGLTANTMNEDRVKCFQAGMDDFVSKPVNKNDLVNAIEEVYRKKSSESTSMTGAHDERLSVDLDTLIDKLGRNHAQILHCLEIFKTDAPKSLESIRGGLKNKDARESKKSCHGLRGMLLTMEMHKAAAIASKMETFIIEKKFENSQALLSLLEKEIELAISFIVMSINRIK
jgi:CheY-like chemotaxis protein/HPt (histidine-containing phosphotransfer) domain-containing protein